MILCKSKETIVNGIVENSRVKPLRYSGILKSSNLSAINDAGASSIIIHRTTLIRHAIILKSQNM